MDSLKEVWNQANVSQTQIHIGNNELKNALHTKSNGVIEKLNQRLTWKLWYIISSIGVFLAIMILSTSLLAQVLSAFINLIFIISGYLLYREKQIIKSEVQMESDLLNTLSTYKTKVERILKLEEYIGLLTYPFNIVTGYVIGISISNNPSMVLDTTDYIILTVCTLAFFPLAHYMTKWMNKLAFGKYLAQLTENIENLKN